MTLTTLPKLSIVIPCYNEAENIPLILAQFDNVLSREDVELVLVNNGSTDDSSSVFAAILPRYPFARLVTVPVNQGYGYGILAGLRQSPSASFLGWTHADMQTNLADVLTALTRLESHPAPETVYVKGQRRNRSMGDNFFTAGMSLFESLYFGTSLWDINAQPNLFHRSFFEAWDNPPYDFSLDLYAFYLARYKGLNLLRVNVAFPPRRHGHSKWNTGLLAKWRFIQRTLQFSVLLKKTLQGSTP